MAPNLSSATRIGLNILAFLGLSLTLYLGHTVIIPLVIAAMLAVILYPAATWLNRKLHIPWFFACLSVILAVVAVNVAIFVGFAFSIPSMLEQLPNPRDTDRLEQIYSKSRDVVASVAPGSVNRVMPVDPQRSTVFAYVKKFLEGDVIVNQFVVLGKAVGVWLLQSIIILFVMLFMMLEGAFLGARIREIFGTNGVIQSRVRHALTEMIEAIRSYLVWRTIVNCGLGLFLGIIYSLMDLKQPWTWALLTALLSYIPYIGTIIAGIPPVLDALINCSPWHALFIMLIYIIVVTVEGYLIVPLVMGRSMDLNATTVMLACLYWDLVWGTMGLFLAMPVMAGIRAICLHTEGWETWANLMSTEKGVKMMKKPNYGSDTL
ncbi:MAG: AI-2E family transporter [Zavarzinella sp.]